MEVNVGFAAVSVALLWGLGIAVWLLGARRQVKRLAGIQLRFAHGESASVIVAAHNAEATLRRCLRSLAEQRHPHFECIVVDDRSTDATAALVEEFAARDGRFRLVRVGETPPGWSPKKWALSRGIAEAKHPLLLFTDADCVAPPEWVGALSAALSQQADVVIGTGPVESRRDSMLASFQQFENRWHTAQLMGAAGWGPAHFAVGRSLGYRRSAYEAAGGFESHRGVLSGDDDLLLHSLPPQAQVLVVPTAEFATTTAATPSWGRYWAQRRRHVGASLHYPPRWRVLLGLWGAFELVMPAALFALIVLGVGQSIVGMTEGQGPLLLIAALLYGLHRTAFVAVTAMEWGAPALDPWMLVRAPAHELLHWVFTLALALALPWQRRQW